MNFDEISLTENDLNPLDLQNISNIPLLCDSMTEEDFNFIDDIGFLNNYNETSNDEISSDESIEENNEEIPINPNGACLWTSTIKNLTRHNFIGKFGIQKNIEILNSDGILRPMDVFFTFIDNKVLKLMVTETNRYAEQLKNTKILSKSSRYHRWKETDCDEMKKFLGILMFMGLVNFPRIEYYWRKDSIYYHPLLHKIGISYNRFVLLLRFWHFVDNSTLSQDNDVTTKIQKVQPLIDLILSNVQELYHPGDTVIVTESMIPIYPQGKITEFKQQMLLRSNKKGIRIFKLRTTKGFVWSFSVHYDRDQSSPIQSLQNHVVLDKSGKILMNLTKNLLNEGRLFITDDFFTSIPLANYLKNHSSDLCGIMSKTFNDEIPEEIITVKLKKGEHIVRQYNSTCTLIKWYNKKNILILSTCHNDEMVMIKEKTKNEENTITKPKALLTYNSGKQCIEMLDQMSRDYTPIHRSVVWYKRVAIELIFGSIVVNSWLIYNELNHDKDTTLLQFTEKLIEKILNVKIDDEIPIKSSSSSSPDDHFISKIPRKEDNKIIRRRCHECYKRLQSEVGTEIAAKKTKVVDTECLTCKKAYCLKCFELSHKKPK